jgi:hypothetical protein
MKLKHFSIRDLLWLTLVVALVTGWWIDRGKLNDRIESLRRRPPTDPRLTILSERVDHAESRQRIQQKLVPGYRYDQQFSEECLVAE